MAALYSMLRILSIVAVLAVVSGGRNYNDDDEERNMSFRAEMDEPIIVYTDDQESSESSYSRPGYSSSYKDNEPSYKEPSTTYSKPSSMSHSSYRAPSSTYQEPKTSYEVPKPSYSSYQAPSTYQAPSRPSYSSYEAPKPSSSSYQAPSKSSYEAPKPTYTPSYSPSYQKAEASSYAPYKAPASPTTYQEAPRYEEPAEAEYEPITMDDLKILPRRILNKYYKMMYSPIYQINRDARTARDNNLVIRNDYQSKQKSGGYGKGGEENEDNYKNCISDIRARGRNALINNLLFSCNGLLFNLFGSNGMDQDYPEQSKH